MGIMENLPTIKDGKWVIKKNFPQSHHFEIFIIDILEIPKKKKIHSIFPR